MSGRLLLLCHANVARSPSAELIAARLLGAGSDWRVESAGTHAEAGRGLDPELSDALRARGLSTAGHRARQADGRMLAGTDPVLVFEAGQREWVTRHFPAAARRTTTVRRAARLAGAAPGVPLLRLLADDTASYGAEDDFADPFGRGPDVAAAAVEDIDALLRVILPALGALPVGAEPPAATVRSTRRSLRRDRAAETVAR
ncbi:hypothetical protein C5C74_10330 [Rathayibacter sp. AY1E8]|uniref:arsenate reductase/protein-tyrosine-phosphatase family protein n=1 Tax=Rathayibacter sp. AY1E8 TaxID=2080555 RepID=UPI000CE7AD70|nr:hypothetical protein [Rathayibacter sp. AY1E8]PPG17351.1 hypothetical protein C5C74_10330 [Rathayibacter sp. AY1E8]